MTSAKRDELREVAWRALARDGRTMSAGAFMKGGDGMDTVLIFNAICDHLERQCGTVAELDEAMLRHIAQDSEDIGIGGD